MNLIKPLKPLAGALLLLASSHTWAVDKAAENTYLELCSVCHSEQRIGGTGPALLPESLGRIKKAEAINVIANGRPASQMIGYKDVLSS